MVTLDEKLIYYAIRKESFTGDKVLFYNSDKKLIATSKHRYFLIIGFGHKVQFINEQFSRVVRISKARFTLLYGNEAYSLVYNLFSMDNRLYLNGEEEGNFKIINQTNLTYQGEFCCNSEISCRIFTMLYIIQDWFTFG
jgi:hypothetical protein